jgi:hypothetical protein
MPVSMPYHLEVGPSLGALERVLNHPDQATRRGIRIQALTDLRDMALPLDKAINNLAAGVRKLPALQTKATYNWQADAATLDDLAANLTTVWLGGYPQSAAPPAVHEDRYYDSVKAAGQPGWQFYQGNVERILRDTLVLALEAASNLNPGAPIVATARFTPASPLFAIAITWKCAQPWLEGWVQWRTVDGRRSVVVIVCTPGDGNYVGMKPTLGYLEPAASAMLAKARMSDFRVPATGATDKDAVVVTEAFHVLDPSVARSVASTAPAQGIATRTRRAGQFFGAPLPWFGGLFSSPYKTEVLHVAPAIYDGGV